MMTITRDLNDNLTIDTNGQIFDKKLGDFLVPKINKEGYLYVYFDKKTHLLHRLVALNFIPNPQNKPIVNHIDGNRQNPTVRNLEWATHKENSNKTILQSSSYKTFKELYIILGDNVLQDVLNEIRQGK